MGQILRIFPTNTKKGLPSWAPDYSQHGSDREEWDGFRRESLVSTREIDCWVIMGTLNIRGVDFDIIETTFDIHEVDPMNLVGILYTIEFSMLQQRQKKDQTDVQYWLQELPRKSLVS
jgi:hypothetical protein